MANWERFAHMIRIRKLLSQTYAPAYRSVNTPPERSYDDILRSMLLKSLCSLPGHPCTGYFGNLASHQYMHALVPDLWDHYLCWIAFSLYNPWLNMDMPWASPPKLYVTADPAPKISWVVNGNLCYRGRKEIPHYVPSMSGWTLVDMPGWRYMTPDEPQRTVTVEAHIGYLERWYYRYDFIIYSRMWNYQTESQADSLFNEKRTYCVLRDYNHPLQTVSSYIIQVPPASVSGHIPFGGEPNTYQDKRTGFLQSVIDPG